MVAKAPEPYDFGDSYLKYSGLNPLYEFNENSIIEDERARAEVEGLFYDENGEIRDEREIHRRIDAFRAAIQAKIPQMEGNKTWVVKGPAELRKVRQHQLHGKPKTIVVDEFEESERTLAKTAQDVLVGKADRMKFTRAEVEERDLIGDIVIDIRRVTNTVLKNLGLEEHLPRKRAKMSEKLEARKAAIPEIKEMLSGLVPIRVPGERGARDDKAFRAMRIGKGQNEGYVMGTQTIRGEKILFKTDIYSAGRRLAHIDKSYRAEIDKLMSIARALETLKDNISYFKNPERAEDVKKIFEMISELVDSLEFVHDESKLELKETLSGLTGVEDSRGRVNIPSKRARINGAENRLGKRIKSIRRISSYLQQDDRTLQAALEREEAPIRDFQEKVEKYHDRLSILGKKPLENGEKVKVVSNLNALKSECAKMQFEPNLSFGRKFVDQIDKILAAIEGGDQTLAAREFVELYAIVKLKSAHSEVQKIYRRISLSGEVEDPKKIFDELQKIQDTLKVKGVAPQIPAGDERVNGEYTKLDLAYGQVYWMLNSLKKKLKTILPEEKTPSPKDEEKPSMRASLKKGLAEILSPFMGKSDVVDRFIKRIKTTTQESMIPHEPVGEIPLEQKLPVFEAMKNRIDELSFVDLVKTLC
jgi:hypothetical protein